VTRTLHRTVHIVGLCKEEFCFFIFRVPDVNAVCGKFMLSRLFIFVYIQELFAIAFSKRGITREFQISTMGHLISCFMAPEPLVGQALLIIEASRSHSDTPHSIGLLWMSDQPEAETCTWQNTALTRDRSPCPRLESNPQSQQANSGRPKP